MYTLQPCVEWKRFRGSKRPEPKQHPDGSPMYEQWTRPGSSPQVLRDFKILPDKASFTCSAATSDGLLTSVDIHRGSLVVY